MNNILMLVVPYILVIKVNVSQLNVHFLLGKFFYYSLLNMFRTSLSPSSGAHCRLTLAVK
jgi:hypothetical protein